MSCPESCYFNLPSCDCAFRPWKADNDTVIPCGAIIDEPLFGAGAELDGVSVVNSVAIFGGDASVHVALEKFPQFDDYSGPLAMELRYREMEELTSQVALLSSRACTTSGFLMITVDRDAIMVQVSTDAGTLNSLEVPTVGFRPTEWKTLRLADNNEYLSLSVSNGVDAYIARTQAPSYPYVKCGLDIGKADFVESFQGQVDRFTLYQCIPDTILA